MTERTEVIWIDDEGRRTCKGDDEVDLLSDSGYTQDLSLLSPVENVQIPETKLKCASLKFSDDEDIDTNGNKREMDIKFKYDMKHCDDTCEPQDVHELIMKNDIEFISGEVTGLGIDNDDVVYRCEDSDIFCTCPILILPREIILKIFTYIAQNELCLSLAKVCKLWYSYAFDPSLWRTIDLHNNRDIPSINLCCLIAKATNLKTLVLHGRESISESEVTVFTQYTHNLKHLDLGFCMSVNDAILTIIVKHCPLLESINLEGNTNIRTGSIQILSMCKFLKNLNFSHCCIENEDLHHLAKSLDTIVSCNIDGISWILDEPIIYLIQQHHETLQELTIDGAEITDNCYKQIATCTNLISLQSSFCEMLSDNSLIYLQSLKKLKTLRLRKGTEFSTDGLKRFFSSSAVTQLTSLDLSECTGFEDNCVFQMTKSCGKTLTNLSLCWCWNITDHGATSIVDHCSNVVHLDMTGIDKMNGECFGRVPTEMPHLRLLDLKQCNRIKDELIESVVRQKKDLTAINYYGEEVEYGI